MARRPAIILLYLLLTGLLLAGAGEGYAQTWLTQAHEYPAEGGISHWAVRCITQDRQGFIWIGTEQGLSRFDGYRFQFWTKSKNNLQYDRVDDIFEDPDGLLWLFYQRETRYQHTTLGIDVFNPKTEQVLPFERYFAGKLPPGILSRLMLGWATDPEGAIYLGLHSPSAILKYHHKTGFTPLSLPSGSYFEPLLCSSEGGIWGRHYQQLGDFRSFTLQAFSPQTGRFDHTLGEAILIQSTGVRHTTDGRFLYQRRQNNEPTEVWEYIPGQQPRSIAPVKRTLFQSHPLWTYLAGHKLMAQDNTIVETATGAVVLDVVAQMPALRTLGMSAWLVDQRGKLWIGCPMGLASIDLCENRFRRLLWASHLPDKHISVRGIIPYPDGSLRVNTEKQGQVSIAANGMITGLLKEQNNSLYQYGLIKDAQDKVYNVPDNFHLERIAPDGSREEFPWIGERVWGFHFLPGNRTLWAGMVKNGIGVFDTQTGQSKPFSQYNGFPELAQSNVYAFLSAQDGHVWICAETGLYLAHPQTGILKRFWSKGKGNAWLPVDHCLFLYIDGDGIFWLCTHGNGLVRWDRTTGQVTPFGRKSGLPVETLYAAYEDTHGMLWLPSDIGIVQFDKHAGEVHRIYGENQGISHREFNRIAHARGADGTLYFGSLNGITVFHPEDFYDPQPTPPAALRVVNCAKYDARTTQMVDISTEVRQTNRICLRPGDGYFTLDLALLTYTDPSHIQYGYRLDGDSIWHFQTDRSLRFGGLDFGQHQLSIRAQAADGTWATNTLHIGIEQIRPLYLRWWFLALMVVCLGIGIAALVRWRTDRLRRRQREVEAEIQVATAQISRQAAELQQLNTLKSRFFANVSHELRTPLTLILGPLAANLKRPSEDAIATGNTRTAYYHARQLLRLVNELLDVSKLEAGKMEYHATPVVLYPFLRRVISSFESHAERLNIAFSWKYQVQDRLQLRLDTDKITKILNNLLSNALKFTPAGGSVHVQVVEQDAAICISVKDTGRGIHPDDLPYVFDRFFQSRQPDAPTEGGTGIGLALSQEFVALMGGKIWVESAPGSGSTFSFTFPKEEIMGVADTAAETEGEFPPVLPVADPVKSALQGQTVLIVEDNPSLRQYVGQVLSPKYRLHLVEHGQAALDWLRTVPALPDLILSDVMMPVMDGFQFLESLKADARLRTIPVVMLTARADIADKLRALRIGVDDYILKPFEAEELSARVEALLRNHLQRLAAAAEAARTAETEPLAAVSSPPPSEDEQWLLRFEALVKARLSDSKLTTDALAGEMAMSRSTLFRQVKRLTGLTAAQYLDEARFLHARTLLETRAAMAVKTAAYESGFLQVAHFSRSFHERFGKYPSEYLE